MNVSLIYPFPDLDRKQIRINGKIPPLGLLYIAASLKKAGHEPNIIDANLNEFSLEKTASVTAEKSPDVIGVSTNTANYSLIKDLARALREKVRAPIVIGGHHPTALPHACIRTGLFDYVVAGEGEIGFTSLVDCISGSRSAENVPGVGFQKDSQIYFNTPEVIEDINVLPPKAWDLLDIQRYCPSPASYLKRPAISTILGRGCPKNCVYCSVNSVFKGITRMHSMEIIQDELEYLQKKGIRDINFWDSVFTYDHPWVQGVCCITKELGLIWNCNARVDMVDGEILELMRQSGCYEIGYGIEVASEESLERMKKGTTFSQALESLRLTRKAGIMVKCYFLVGLPWETKAEIEETLSFARRINPDFATFSITNPYPGCELFEKVKEKLEKDDFSNMNHLSGKYSVSEHFTTEDLNRLVNKAYRNYYLRPAYVWNVLKRMRSLEDIKRSLGSVKDIFYSG